MFCFSSVKPEVPRCTVPDSATAGSSAELRCLENEGFPQSQYQWFRNDEELPEDPKSSLRFLNSSYIVNPDTGTLVSDEGPPIVQRIPHSPDDGSDEGSL